MLVTAAGAAAGAVPAHAARRSVALRTAASRADSPVAATNAGRVRGYLDNGIAVFKGLRYGADTAGRRFLPPVPPTPWTEVREATSFGPIAPQPGQNWVLGEDGGGDSEVRFELTPQGDRVHLVVTHSRLADRDTMLSVAGGWHAHLEILEARLDGREPPGFWRTHTRLESEYAQRIPAA